MPGMADPFTGENFLSRFFGSHSIDEFAVIDSSALQAPSGRRPTDLFPACRTVIIFGKVMGDDLFMGPVSETAPRTGSFKAELARVSSELAAILRESGSDSVPVTSVIVQDGRLKGGLSLKHCARDAGLGEIGDNGLLLSPRYGIRLGLGAVLTAREIPPAAPAGEPGPLCTHCGLCIRACPANALLKNGIDSFRCLNITGALPGPAATLFEKLMGMKALEPVLTKVASRVASRSRARCSECLIACPLFKKFPAR